VHVRYLLLHVLGIYEVHLIGTILGVYLLHLIVGQSLVSVGGLVEGLRWSEGINGIMRDNMNRALWPNLPLRREVDVVVFSDPSACLKMLRWGHTAGIESDWRPVFSGRIEYRTSLRGCLGRL